MQFETAAPHPALRRWIRYYWLLDEPAGFTADSEPVVPDGVFELVAHLADFPEQFRNGSWARQPSAMLVGEIQRPTLLRAAGPVRCVGVHFAPGGVAAFFDEPATLLRDRMTPLDALERPMVSLRDRLDPAAGLETLAHEIDVLLLGRLRHCAPGLRTLSILGLIEQSEGRIAIDAVASDAGVSVRQLERRLGPILGIPPKRFARVVRFHHAFSALLGGDRDAALDGYFDQSHFLRDLREFASAPAREVLANSMLLNRQFHRQRPEPDINSNG